MEQQKPQIPSLKDSQKPQVKIKGLQAGLSLIDRLKQFKKKDLMFISAGLGVLFMAPLAEHLLMAPEQGRGGAMTEGWSFGKNDGLGTNVSPFESGINGLAPGGVTGGGDIITPLNVRDPSALVMGPGAQQQAPATNTTPAPPPPAKEDDKGWRDALANSASAAAKEATKKASLPVPKPSLTNAGLRGLGAVAGGGGGSYSPGAISSQGLAGNKAAGRDFTRVQAAPGYRGAAGARGANSGSSGSFENLKKAAGGMTDTLNRSGPASSALESAANTGMGGGAGSGIGGGGHGENEKGPSGSQNKDSMNVGESLEFMRQKMEQEKALDLKWKLKEADAMLWPELRKDILKTLVTKPLEGLAGDIGKSFGAWGGAKGGSKDVYECDGPGGKISFNRGDVVSCRDSSVGGKEGSARYCIEGSTIRDLNLNGATYANCQIKAGEATAGAPKTEGGLGSVMPVGDGGAGYSGPKLDDICAALKGDKTDAGMKLYAYARRATNVRDALYKGPSGNECSPVLFVKEVGGKKTVLDHQLRVKALLGGDKESMVEYLRQAALAVGASAADIQTRAGKLSEGKPFAEAGYSGPGASKSIAEKIEAELVKAQETSETKAKGLDDKIGKLEKDAAADPAATEPLPAAKGLFDVADAALTSIKNNETKGDAPDVTSVGLPTDGELAALKEDVAKIDKMVQLKIKPVEIHEGLQKIVASQREYYERAVKAQADLKKRLEEAVELRPTSTKLVGQLKAFRTLKPAAGSVKSAGKPAPEADLTADGSTAPESKDVFGEGKVGETTLPEKADLEADESTADGKAKKEAAKKALVAANGTLDKEIKRLKTTGSYIYKQVEAVETKGVNVFKDKVTNTKVDYRGD